MMIKGTCHCEAVRWQFNGTPASATACNCTICRRYAGIWAYGFKGAEFDFEGPTRVYLRGEKEILWHFCEQCGCLAYWCTEPGDDGRIFGAVNLRMAEPKDVADVPIVHFDGLDTFKPLPGDDACVTDIWF